jgi:hypothetical protein
MGSLMRCHAGQRQSPFVEGTTVNLEMTVNLGQRAFPSLCAAGDLKRVRVLQRSSELQGHAALGEFAILWYYYRYSTYGSI